MHSWPHIPDGSGSLDASAAGSSHLNANLVPTITADNKLSLSISGIDIGTRDLPSHFVPLLSLVITRIFVS